MAPGSARRDFRDRSTAAAAVASSRTCEPMSRLVSAVALSCMLHGSATAVMAQRPAMAPSAAALEAKIDVARMAGVVRTISRAPRVTGYFLYTPIADTVLRRFAAAGLDTARSTFRAYLPQPRGTTLLRESPAPANLPSVELRVADDSATFTGIWPQMAAFSPSDSVSGPLLYAHLGRPADYAQLDSLRIDPAGAIILVRASGIAPWVLAREAAARKAKALLLYPDPADDGYVIGDAYPYGRMRHPDAMRRVQLHSRRGDPATPGYSSLDSLAVRAPEAAMSFPAIPVASINFRTVASGLMGFLRYPARQPAGWQGGMPLRYHAGQGEVRVSLVTDRETGDSAYKAVTNTFASLRGRERPDEVVLVGARRDAFGPGATDNGGGVAALLELGQLLGEAAARGERPGRTIVLATWDASAWGEVGAVEWAEGDSALRRRVVAYVDLDRLAAGRTLELRATPDLATFARSLLRDAPAPESARTLEQVWAAGRPTDALPAIPAGRGDAPALVETAALPTISFGFHDPDGVRDSGYDTYVYLERYGDPGFAALRAGTVLAIRAALRLAEAERLPYAAAATPRWALAALAAERARPGPAVRWAELERAISRAAALGAALDAAAVSAADRDQLNAAGRLSSADWHAGAEFGHLLYGIDPVDGVSLLPLPALARARRATDAVAAARASDALLAAAERVVRRLAAAAAAARVPLPPPRVVAPRRSGAR